MHMSWRKPCGLMTALSGIAYVGSRLTDPKTPWSVSRGPLYQETMGQPLSRQDGLLFQQCPEMKDVLLRLSSSYTNGVDVYSKSLVRIAAWNH